MSMMENLSRTISRATNALRDKQTALAPSEAELYYYKSIYKVVDSIVGAMADMMPTIPPDLVKLHMDCERLLRRSQIRGPESEDELLGALVWMHFFGNRGDLNVLKDARGLFSRSYPLAQIYFDATISAVQARASSFNWYALAIVGVSIAFFLFGAISVHFFSEQKIALAMGLLGGLSTSVFLFREGFDMNKRLIDRICLIAAGVLMIVETAGLIYVLEGVK